MTDRNSVQPVALQWKYTSCEYNLDKSSGFATFSMSNELTEEEKDELAGTVYYRLPDSYPDQPSREDLERAPVGFSFFRLRSGRSVVCRTVAVGKDYAGARYGNFFAHAFVLKEGEWDNPLAYARSSNFASRLTDTEANLGHVPDPLQPLDLDAIERKPPQTEGVFDQQIVSGLFVATTASLIEGRKLVVVADENDLAQAPELLAALLKMLPAYVAKKVSFAICPSADSCDLWIRRKSYFTIILTPEKPTSAASRADVTCVRLEDADKFESDLIVVWQKLDKDFADFLGNWHAPSSEILEKEREDDGKLIRKRLILYLLTKGEFNAKPLAEGFGLLSHLSKKIPCEASKIVNQIAWDRRLSKFDDDDLKEILRCMHNGIFFPESVQNEAFDYLVNYRNRKQATTNLRAILNAQSKQEGSEFETGVKSQILKCMIGGLFPEPQLYAAAFKSLCDGADNAFDRDNAFEQTREKLETICRNRKEAIANKIIESDETEKQVFAQGVALCLTKGIFPFQDALVDLFDVLKECPPTTETWSSFRSVLKKLSADEDRSLLREFLAFILLFKAGNRGSSDMDCISCGDIVLEWLGNARKLASDPDRFKGNDQAEVADNDLKNDSDQLRKETGILFGEFSKAWKTYQSASARKPDLRSCLVEAVKLAEKSGADADPAFKEWAGNEPDYSVFWRVIALAVRACQQFPECLDPDAVHNVQPLFERIIQDEKQRNIFRACFLDWIRERFMREEQCDAILRLFSCEPVQNGISGRIDQLTLILELGYKDPAEAIFYDDVEDVNLGVEELEVPVQNSRQKTNSNRQDEQAEPDSPLGISAGYPETNPLEIDPRSQNQTGALKRIWDWFLNFLGGEPEVAEDSEPRFVVVPKSETNPKSGDRNC